MKKKKNEFTNKNFDFKFVFWFTEYINTLNTKLGNYLITQQ